MPIHSLTWNNDGRLCSKKFRRVDLYVKGETLTKSGGAAAEKRDAEREIEAFKSVSNGAVF
jgi:hypothetical protein